MNNYPQWVLGLTDTDLKHDFGVVGLTHGEMYANLQRVSAVSVDGTSVAAAVRGAHGSVYQTRLSHTGILTASCTCPVGRNCKHAAALIIHIRRFAIGDAVPRWRQVMTPLVSDAHRVGAVPLALEFSSGALGLMLRPLAPGRRESWVRAGTSWDELRSRPAKFIDAQIRALGDLEAAHEGGHTQELAFSRLRPEAWDALRQAVAAGVVLFPGKDSIGRQLLAPRLLPTAVEPLIRISAGDNGAVLLVPEVAEGQRYFDVPPRALLGYHAHGVALAHDDELLLAPFTRRLDLAEHGLFSAGPLTIPPAELPLFVAGYLPSLKKRLRIRVDKDVVLPEPPTPRLVCTISYQDGAVHLSWTVRYVFNGIALNLDLEPNPDDPRIRQPFAEYQLRQAVPGGPWYSDQAKLRTVLLTGRDLIEFLSSVLPQLEAHPDIDVVAHGQVPTYRQADEPPDIVVAISDAEQGDWFNLNVELRVAGEAVPFADLFRALNEEEEHLVLASGVWFSLDTPELSRLRQLIAEARTLVDFDGDTLRLRPEHAGLWEEFTHLAVMTEQTQRWRRSVEGLLSLDALPDDAPPAQLRTELRPYQLTGYRWLRSLWRSGIGGILADEMGLGKTLQALAMVQGALADGELNRPVLVVAPTTVLGTWASEAAHFTPDLRVVTISETEARRGAELSEAISGAHLVLTSYTLLRLEAEHYQALEWSAVLLDEAQFVKNRGSKAHQAVRHLNARFTVALTGTPLENNLMDLWSLLALTAPGLFRSSKTFTEQYRGPIERGDQETLGRLHRRVRPLMLRRTKASVATELPPKQAQLIPVKLSAAHRTLYDRHLIRERQKILGLVDQFHKNNITILRSLTMLRQLSLSPSLVDASYPAHSAKIDTLVDLLDEVVGGGHRALVFSQFTGFLSLVQERLRAEEIGFAYLDGATRHRDKVVAAFRDGTAPVFLISLKAGGFGLNLTEADYVFILDPWWNPAAETQAIDRAHRIGQDRRVNVYRLVASDTIEEKVVALQERKRHLFDAVVGTVSALGTHLTADDVQELLSDQHL